MAILDITINGRTHQIACDDGQETHLKTLGREIDAMVQNLAISMGGQVADGTLLALTGLMLLDELNEAKEQNQQLKLQMGSHSHAFESAKRMEIERNTADLCDELAERIDNITRAVAG